MRGDSITYKSGYKYQLSADYEVMTDLQGLTVQADFYSMAPSGLLKIKAGYAWDGPSGPTFDTKTFMRASLVHDVGYQMMAEGQAPQASRGAWDRELRKICIEDGMWRVRAWWVFKAVQEFGDNYGREPKANKFAP